MPFSLMQVGICKTCPFVHDAACNLAVAFRCRSKFSVPRQSLLVSKDAKTTRLHCSRPLQAYKETVCTFSELVEALYKPTMRTMLNLVLRCLDTLMEVFQPLPLGGLDSAAPLRMSLRSEIGFTCLKCVKVCHANLRHNP